VLNQPLCAADESPGELAIAGNKFNGVHGPILQILLAEMRERAPFYWATTKARISSRCLSAGRTFVFAAIVGRSILEGKRVSAVNVPACSRRAAGDTSNPRARNDLWKNKEERARTLRVMFRFTSCTCNIFHRAFTSHVCSSLYYFYAALRAYAVRFAYGT